MEFLDVSKGRKFHHLKNILITEIEVMITVNLKGYA